MAFLRRFAAPLLGLLLAVGLFLQTGPLDAVAAPGQLGPGFWPRLSLAGLGLACLIKLVQSWRARPDDATTNDTPPLAGGTLALAIACMLGYVAITPLVGFPVATAAFVVAFMAIGGARSWAGIVATTAAGTTALLYLFVKLVYLPLPKGEGPFEALTLALYRALRIF
jgi:putative tricarboxylic transport membrane protein